MTFINKKNKILLLLITILITPLFLALSTNAESNPLIVTKSLSQPSSGYLLRGLKQVPFITLKFTNTSDEKAVVNNITVKAEGTGDVSNIKKIYLWHFHDEVGTRFFDDGGPFNSSGITTIPSVITPTTAGFAIRPNESVELTIMADATSDQDADFSSGNITLSVVGIETIGPIDSSLPLVGQTHIFSNVTNSNPQIEYINLADQKKQNISVRPYEVTINTNVSGVYSIRDYRGCKNYPSSDKNVVAGVNKIIKIDFKAKKRGEGWKHKFTHCILDFTSTDGRKTSVSLPYFVFFEPADYVDPDYEQTERIPFTILQSPRWEGKYVTLSFRANTTVDYAFSGKGCPINFEDVRAEGTAHKNERVDLKVTSNNSNTDSIRRCELFFLMDGVRKQSIPLSIELGPYVADTDEQTERIPFTILQSPRWEGKYVTLSFRANTTVDYAFSGKGCPINFEDVRAEGTAHKNERVDLKVTSNNSNTDSIRRCELFFLMDGVRKQSIPLSIELGPYVADTDEQTGRPFAIPSPVTPETGAIEFIQKPKWEDDGSITFRFRAGADGKYFFMGRVCEAVAASNTPINGSVRKGEIIKIHAHAPQGYLKNAGMVRTCDFVLGAPDRYLAVIDLQDHLPQIKDAHLVCVEVKNQWKCTPNSYASTTTPNNSQTNQQIEDQARRIAELESRINASESSNRTESEAQTNDDQINQRIANQERKIRELEGSQSELKEQVKEVKTLKNRLDTLVEKLKSVFKFLSF